jgi:hypothetical protein
VHQEKIRAILDWPMPKNVTELRSRFWERKLRSRVIRECLIILRGIPLEDATWESEQVLQHHGLVLLEDKQFREGRTVM